jgi:S-(hydroxymethyl)glutathione dehydrogenase/alcohol dehydrogenase
MKARGAVLFGPGTPLEVCDVEVAPPRAGEALVRMAAAGVSHTDLHVMQGKFAAPLPAVLGHEGAGVVAEVGPGVTSLKAGDHVVPLWRLSCGKCEFCRRGKPALCVEGMRVRNTGRLPDGTSRLSYRGREVFHYAGVSTFCEFSVVPEAALLALDKSVPLDRAALLGCAVVTGVGAVTHAAQVRPGDTVAVFGAGGVGLNVIQASAAAGAETIVAVDIHPSKLELARRFGATAVVDASKGLVVESIRGMTKGRGVDHAFDAVGAPDTARQAFDVLARTGKLVVLGISKEAVSLPLGPLVFEERQVVGSFYGSGRPRDDIPNLAEMYLSGKLKLDELLTRRYPLEQINEAYAALERGEVARSVVVFDGAAVP